MIRILKLIISILFYLVWRIRRLYLWIMERELPSTCVIIYYHAITSKQHGKFAKQMDELLRWAKPIDAGTEKPLLKDIHYVAVTFDDGFQSVIENALPELIQRKIPFAIFIPAGCLGQHPEWEGISCNPDHYEMVMTAEQLRTLPSDLVSIGSHTLTHPKLTLLREEEAKKEIIESRKQLENILGRKITLFSFPHGLYNQKLTEWARQAGYKRVFTIVPTLAFKESEEFVSGRVKTTPEDWPLEYRLKLMGAYRWLPLASELKLRLRLAIERYLKRNILNYTKG